MGMITPKIYTLKTGERATIHSGQADDAAAAQAITLGAIREGGFMISEPDEFQADEEQEREWLRKHAEEPGWLALVAEVDGRVVGVLSFENGQRRRMAHSGTIGITVATDWREKGVGAALMQALLEWAEAHPLIETVRLGVLSTNSRAIHLYRKLGFIEEGRAPQAFKIAPGRYVDDVMMYRQVKGGAATEAQLREVALRWMTEVWRERRIAAIDELHAPDFVDRSPAGRATDREAYKASIAELFAAFPDFAAETEDLVVDAATGKVAARWTATGAQQGAFLGRKATGRRITFAGIEILRIANGRIVERWGEWDGIALLEQLDG